MLYKNKILELIKAQLASNQSELLAALHDLQKEKSNETKSSAGDKYETSREMMQQTENQLRERLAYINQQINQVNLLNAQKIVNVVANGALVATNHGYLFFGISLGKLFFKEEPIFVLSMNAPLGRALLGKKVGEAIKFQQQLYQIKSIT